MIRIMIVDDHPLVRDGLASVISNQPDMQVVAEAGGGEEAITRFREHRPDVTLMDLRLPNMSGADAIRSIRLDFPEARFLVLTTFDADNDIFSALDAGAQAYVLKDVRREELMSLIRDVHAGKSRVPEEVARRYLAYLAGPRLSGRERQILELVAQGESNKIIADKLKVSESSIRTYLMRVFSKLDVEDRTEAVVQALRRGLIRL
jgi:two-component system, NarL family, response regulator